MVSTAHQKFRAFLRQFLPLDEHDFSEGIKYFRVVHINKGGYFVRVSEICNTLAFVSSGMLRTFFVNDDGEEITYCFCTENHFETSFRSFIQQQPSALSIHVLDDAELLVISYEDLTQLYNESKAWERIGRILSERAYLKMEEQSLQASHQSAIEKYLRLLDEHPQIIRKAPLTYIASYLGMTPRHISRLRKGLTSGHLSGRKQ